MGDSICRLFFESREPEENVDMMEKLRERERVREQALASRSQGKLNRHVKSQFFSISHLNEIKESRILYCNGRIKYVELLPYYIFVGQETSSASLHHWTNLTKVYRHRLGDHSEDDRNQLLR